MTGPINFSNGLTGIRVGLDGIQKTAGQIASKDAMRSESTFDLAKSMVDLKVYKHQVGASALVVKVTDQVLGALLDIKV